MKLETLWHILMYDSSPGEKLHAARVLFRLSVLVFVLWGIGIFAPIGIHGFAKADDVDRKIQAAIEPIYSQLDEIKSRELAAIKVQLDENARIQKRILAAQISSQLRDLHRLKCMTTDPIVRTRMEQDLESAQQEYIVLQAQRYPLPSCKDL